MQYIIFGAGQTGQRAMAFLDYWRVAYFVDNVAKGIINGKQIISFAEMLTMLKNDKYIVVVASARYVAEMVAQLKSYGVMRYFVFHDGAPNEIWQFYPSYRLYRQTVYMPYVRILSLLNIYKYSRIAIYGDNFFLPYLIAEIAFQNNLKNVIGVIKTSSNPNAYTVGVPIMSLDEVYGDIDCIIINERRHNIKKIETLNKFTKDIDVLDIYDVDRFVPEFHHQELNKYKDIHKGKRCFLVGNGPSLTLEDLDTLHTHGEICFGFNNVFRAYGRTKWRPKYFGIGDWRIMETTAPDILKLNKCVIMSDEFHRLTDVFFSQVEYVHVVRDISYPQRPRFSSNICEVVYGGSTVVFDIGIQFAAYMGFKEIYLLGVDCSYRTNRTDARNHFIDNYFDENEKYPNDEINTDVMRKAFMAAREYSMSHGFRIYNATRGGCLEVFERVNFDTLF